MTYREQLRHLERAMERAQDEILDIQRKPWHPSHHRLDRQIRSRLYRLERDYKALRGVVA